MDKNVSSGIFLMKIKVFLGFVYRIKDSNHQVDRPGEIEGNWYLNAIPEGMTCNLHKSERLGFLGIQAFLFGYIPSFAVRLPP